MKRDNKITLTEVAEIIAGFANGTCEPYDWDDFMSCQFKSLEIDKIRRECAEVELRFPARHDHEWCNPQGVYELIRIADKIRQESNNTLVPTVAKRSGGTV